MYRLFVVLAYCAVSFVSVPCLPSRAEAQDPTSKIRLPELEIVTQSRIDQLPEAARSTWNAYLKRSNELAMADRVTLAKELKEQGKTKSQPAPADGGEFEYMGAKLPLEAYKTDEMNRLAATVRSYQTPSGGWSKAVDYTQGPRAQGTHWTTQSGTGWHYCGTLDNRSTTEQIYFLASHATATGDEASKASALAGLNWLLQSQYPSGGWPQVYPLESGYHEAITLNDDAMIHALEILMLVEQGDAPFQFATDELRRAAGVAIQKGIDCLLRAQVELSGTRTVWCAQHDPINLQPLGARLKEPPSLSGGESAQVVKFLMRQAPDTPEVRNAIQAAIAWFEAHKITNLRKTKNAAGKTDYVQDDQTTEVYWGRFYSLDKQQPIFAGSQDGIIYDTYSEMAAKNRVSYDYFTNKPRDLITKEVVRWQKRIGAKP